jgi:hypothetical protein
MEVDNGGLRYRSFWRLEEEQAGMTFISKAAQCQEGMMNSICGWLKLTMETEEMEMETAPLGFGNLDRGGDKHDHVHFL